MTDWSARIAEDPGLRRLLETARAWGVSPSVLLGEPSVTTYTYDHAGKVVRAETVSWTSEDRDVALALANYEASLCPGCHNPLEETSKAEHEEAYRPEPPIRCHYCTARAMVEDAKDDKSEGLLYPIMLDAEIVKLNLLPVPPLPPELGG